MEPKFVNNIRILVICMFMLLTICGVYAQSEIYFLIDKNDTLIKKQSSTRENKFEGYLIIDEQRIKPLNKTPIKIGRVWVPESDDDFHTLGPSFSFNGKNDKIITKEELKDLSVIINRKKFLKIFSSDLDFSSISYFFIEPIICTNNFLLRQVFPVIVE